MRNLVILFLQLLFQMLNVECTDYRTKYGLAVDLQQWKCDPSFFSSLTPSSEIFSQADPSITAISDFTVTGWFFFRGYVSLNYNVITVTESTTQIYSIQYNYFSQQLYISLLSAPFVAILSVAPITNNSWYFIYVRIQYLTQISITVLVYQTASSTSLTVASTFLQNSSTHQSNFIKANLLFNYGSLILTGVPCACSYTKKIYLYWSTQLNESGLDNLVLDYIASDANLYWQFDSFYTTQNPNYIINFINPNQKYQIEYTQPLPLILSFSQYFTTDNFNTLSYGGCIISFHAKISNPNSVTVVSLMPTSYVAFKIFSNIIYLISKNTNMSSGTYTLTNWNQFTLIIKQSILQKVYLIINGDQPNKIEVDGVTIYPLAYLQFGDPSNTNTSIQFSDIRVYLGTFLTSSTDCLFQTETPSRQCIICSSSNLIDYQNGNQCVQPSSINQSTLVSNVKDWYPKQFTCPQDMVLDGSTSSCVCRYQFYRKGDLCFQCPNYCQGCTDSTTCISQDSNRGSDGNCSQGYFDDGVSCISRNTFTIYSRVNLQIPYVGASDLLSNCLPSPLPSVSLSGYAATILTSLLDNQTQFFMSFSFKATTPYQTVQSVIGYILDKKTSTELFTFIYDTLGGATTPHEITLLSKGVLVSSLQINPAQTTWIGLWTNLRTAIFIVYSNGVVSTTFNPVSLSTYTSPSLEFCIGKCVSQTNLLWTCGSIMTKSLNFIYNVDLPQYNSDIINLISENSLVFAVFTLPFLSFPSPSTVIPYNQNGVNLNLQLNQICVLDRMKGIQFIPGAHGDLSGLTNFFPTFSSSIYIEQMESQVQLVYYKIGQIGVQYMLVPYGTRAFIRIIVYNESFETTNSMLFQNQNNTLTIISRNQGILTDIAILSFEIICNYQRETVQIQIPNYNFGTISVDNFSLMNNPTAKQYSIYLNKISIENGDSSYYVDYSETDNCFLYRNVYNMKCAIPKQGFVLYNGMVISISDCINLKEVFNTLFVVNYSTNQCENTYLSPLCSEIDNLSSTITCKTCIYQNADILNSCNCPDGTYLDDITMSCLACSDLCLTCQNSYNNCIQCKYSDQYPPTCQCTDLTYFLNSSNVCQSCSAKCESCSQEDTNCITCASNRVEPPSCICDSGFTETSSGCTAIVCDAKCNGCTSSSSNCSYCKAGRENSPDCTCKDNFYPVSDGTCVECPSSQFYDQTTESCQACQAPCTDCVGSANYCKACEIGYQIVNSKCTCSDNTTLITLANGSLVCAQNMDLKFKLILSNDHYILQFTFDYDLQPINFQSSSIDSLVTLYFSEIQSSSFAIENPQINGNILTAQLIVKSNFSTLTGSILFKQNTPFISTSLKYILNKSYTIYPLKFDVGPFIFQKSTLGSVLDSMITQLQDQNSYFQSFVRDSQLLVYLLNTAQPTLLFLQLNAVLPPNLYKFYQVIGLLIYPDVVNYESTDYKDSFQLFTKSLNHTQVYPVGLKIYKKLGFSNSFLINVPVVIVKYCLIFLVFGILIFLSVNMPNRKQKLDKLIQTVLKRINSENEINLLMVMTSLWVQYTETDQYSWAVRYGYYLNSGFVLLFIISFCCNAKEINEKKEITEECYSYQFRERLQIMDTFLQRNYFLSQLLKKYLVISILFLLQSWPIVACSFNGMIFFISAIYTFASKPYLTTLSRFIKIGGELVLGSCWYIHIVIIKIEQDLFKEPTLDEKKVSLYITIGNVVILLLSIFNILFLIELFSQLVNLIKTKLANKEKQQVKLLLQNVEKLNGQIKQKSK